MMVSLCSECSQTATFIVCGQCGASACEIHIDKVLADHQTSDRHWAGRMIPETPTSHPPDHVGRHKIQFDVEFKGTKAELEKFKDEIFRVITHKDRRGPVAIRIEMNFFTDDKTAT